MVPRIDIEIADKEWGCLHQTGKVKPGQNRLKKLDLGNGSANIKSTEISTHKAGANHQKVGNCVLSPHSGTHSNNDHNTVEFLLSLAIRPDMPPKEITRYRELISLAIDKLQLQILHNILSGAKQIN